MPRTLTTTFTLLALAATAACTSDEPVSGKAPSDALQAETDAGPRGLDATARTDTGAHADTAADVARTDLTAPDLAPTDIDPGPLPQALALDPPVVALPAGAALQVHAYLTDSSGQTSEVTTLAGWQVDPPGVATVTHGAVMGLQPGQAVLRAAHAGLQAKAPIVVTAAQAVVLQVLPASATVYVGQTVPLAALATLQDGTQQDVTAVGQWSSSAPEVVAVVAGKVAALAAGKAAVTVALGTLKATAEVSVLPAPVTSLALQPVGPVLAAGMTLQLHAVATYQDGQTAEVTASASYTSSDMAVLAIDAGGLCTALQAGTSVVTASFGGQTAVTVVTVLPIQLAKLTMKPATLELPAGTSANLKVTGQWSDGSATDVTQSAHWTASDAGVAVVAAAPGSKGFVSALAGGNTLVTASFAGQTATCAVTVTQALLQGLAIAPPAVSLPKGGSAQLAAIGTFSDGKTQDLTAEVVWGSTESGVAAVGTASGKKGLVQALQPGTAKVSASLGKLSAASTVTVTAAVITGLAVTVQPPSLVLGQKGKAKAVGTYSDGDQQDLTEQVVWQTDNAKVAVVSNVPGARGIVTSTGPGTTQVEAKVGGMAAQVTLVVTAPVLKELVVTPANPERHAGQTVQFAASAVYSNDTVQNVTQQASWSASDAAVAEQGPTGLFKALAAGNSAIVAMWGGKTGKTTLTVSPAVLKEVQMTPVVWSMPTGVTLQFQAVALWSDNTSQNVTWQSDWVSGNQAVAAVQNTPVFARGRVQALQPGEAEIKATYQGMTGKAVVTVTPAALKALNLFPGLAVAPVGMLRVFTAQALYTDDTSLDVTWQSTWLSDKPDVVTVSNAFGGAAGWKGTAKGLKAGTATVSANYQGLYGSAQFQVTPATLQSLQINPGAVTVAKGVPVKFDVLAVWSDGSAQDVGWATTFTSSDATVAAVSDALGSAGWTQTLKAGTVTIQAAYSGLIAKATLTVTAAQVAAIQVTPAQPKVAKGSWLALDAVAMMSDGTSQQVTWGATWQTSNTLVAAVGGVGWGKGVVQALAAGQSTVSATWGGKTGSTVVTVTAAALQAIQVTPFLATLPVGYEAPFQATGLYSDDTTQALTYLATWTTNQPAVGTVSSAWPAQGWLTPIGPGKVLVQATWQGKTGAASVTVSDAALKNIAVTPDKATVKVGAWQQLAATGTFADGLVMPVTDYVTWLSGAPDVCQVSNAWGSKGKVQGIGKGACEVKAVKGGVGGTAGVVVE
jgi:hypothetical protein